MGAAYNFRHFILVHIKKIREILYNVYDYKNNAAYDKTIKQNNRENRFNFIPIEFLKSNQPGDLHENIIIIIF